MPHDKNGSEVKPGDMVTVRFKVKQISQTENFCNLELQSEVVQKDMDVDASLWLNAGQVELIK